MFDHSLTFYERAWSSVSPPAVVPVMNLLSKHCAATQQYYSKVKLGHRGNYMCWPGNNAEYAVWVFREYVFVFKDWRHTSLLLQVHSLYSPKYLAPQPWPLLIFIDRLLTCMWELAILVPLQPGRPGIYLTNPLSSRPISHNIETTCLRLFSDCWSKNHSKQHRRWISCCITWGVCGLVVFLVVTLKEEDLEGLVKCLVCSCLENMTRNCKCYGWTVHPTMWNSNV